MIVRRSTYDLAIAQRDDERAIADALEAECKRLRAALRQANAKLNRFTGPRQRGEDGRFVKGVKA